MPLDCVRVRQAGSRWRPVSRLAIGYSVRHARRKLKLKQLPFYYPDIWHKVEDESLSEHLLLFVSTSNTNCKQFLFSLCFYRPTLSPVETNEKPTTGSLTVQTCSTRSHLQSLRRCSKPRLFPSNCFISPFFLPGESRCQTSIISINGHRDILEITAEELARGEETISSKVIAQVFSKCHQRGITGRATSLDTWR